MTAPVQGFVDRRFERVREAFEENLRSHGERGAALCVYRGGHLVVDLWCGEARDGEAWDPDTLCVLFSATKGLVAACLLLLIDRGLLDPEKPARHYWPELQADVKVVDILNHRSGLSGLGEPVSLADLADPVKMAELLARQEPLWEPGSDQGYAAVAFGLYGAELVYRVSGRRVGQFLQEELAGPLQADLFLGLPLEQAHRIATLIPPGPWEVLTGIVPALLFERSTEGRMYRQVLVGGPTGKALANPKALGARGLQNYNRHEVLALELPWSGGVASARGLAKLYAGLPGMVKPETLARVMERQTFGFDRVLRKPLGWSWGFLKEELHLYSPNTEAFGHPGMGGTFGYADPKEGLAIGFVTRRMAWRLRPRRAVKLCHAVYASL